MSNIDPIPNAPKWLSIELGADTENSYSLESIRQKMREDFETRPKPQTQQKPSDMQEEVKVLRKKILILEERISMQKTLFEYLEFRLNSLPFEKVLDGILDHVTETFKELNFVKEVHYAPLENGTFELTVIHDLQNRADAMELNYDKLLSVESAFSDIDFKMVLLHKSDVQPDRLRGTKPIFPTRD